MYKSRILFAISMIISIYGIRNYKQAKKQNKTNKQVRFKILEKQGQTLPTKGI